MKRVTAAVMIALTCFALLSGCPANRANNGNQSENAINTNGEGGNIVTIPYERFFKLSDFSEIDIGMSAEEIEKRLGEPSAFAGSGICWDRYALEGGGFVDILIRNGKSTCSEIRIVLPDGRIFVPDGTKIAPLLGS